MYFVVKNNGTKLRHSRRTKSGSEYAYRCLRNSIRYDRENNSFWYDDAPSEMLVYRIPESHKRDFMHDMKNIAIYWRNNGYITSIRPVGVADVAKDESGRPSLKNNVFVMRKNGRKNVFPDHPSLREWSV